MPDSLLERFDPILVLDTETGLMFDRDGRGYDPATGRWLEPREEAVLAGDNPYARHPQARGEAVEYPGLTLAGIRPEYDVIHAMARRHGETRETAEALGRAELLLDLDARTDAAARRWRRLREEATADAVMRRLGGHPAAREVCPLREGGWC